MSRTDRNITVEEAAAILEVTAATVKNWQRTGRLTGGDGLVSVKEIDRIKASDAFKSRRNKSNLGDSRLCGSYLRGHVELKRLLARKELTEDELSVILAEGALRLISPGTGRVEAFLSGELRVPCSCLITDLLEGSVPNENTEKITAASWELTPDGDGLGFIYMSLLPLNRRRSLGAYYTGAEAARLAVSRAALRGRILDPCCGSGSFLVAAAEALGSPLGLEGMDIDPVAVSLARLNLYLRWPKLGTGYLYKNIRVGDFFKEDSHCDRLIGNPPWGGRPERSAAFVLKALDLLEEGGRLTFVLPRSLLTTRFHSPFRRELLGRSRLISADYLRIDSFDGVYCPSVIISAEKSPRPGIAGCAVNGDFTIGERKPDLRCLNLNITDAEQERLDRMRNLKNAVFLKNNGIFALGVVTGRNREVLSRSEGLPLIRGADVKPFRIAEPSVFLNCGLEDCQQTAPAEVYSAPEKIVYRFVGRRPVFAVDRKSRLTLNSCNIIIPRIEGLDIDYITAVLNSSAVGFFLEKTFASEKWLRWQLEEAPIPMIPAELQREIVNSEDWDKRIGELYVN